METIKRLVQLREEHNDLFEGRGEVMIKVIKLEGELERAEKAKRDKILNRFRNGQPVRASSLEDKIKELSTELDEHRAIVRAIDSKLNEVRPELAELEAEQLLAAGWNSVAIPFVASKVLRGEQRGRINQALATARPEVSQNILGQDVVRKSIARNVDGSLPFFIQQLEFQAIEAARRVDPQFPRAETVDLEITGQSLGWDNRASRRHDRRILTDLWNEFLRIEGYFEAEYNLDIAPTAEEVSEAIERVVH